MTYKTALLYFPHLNGTKKVGTFNNNIHDQDPAYTLGMQELFFKLKKEKVKLNV